MYKRELDSILKSKKIPKSLILFGECSYHIEEYSRVISNEISSEKFTIYFDDYDYSIAKNYLSQSSLFGDINLLIIKSNSKIKELKELIKICDRVENSYMLFEYYGDDTRIYASLPNAVRFFTPSNFEAINILESKAKELNIDIDRDSLEHLLGIQNFNISISLNELSKLSIFDSKIGVKEIDNLSFSLTDINLDNFILKVFNKELFFDNLSSLLDREDEIKVILAISNFINQLSLFFLSFHITKMRDSRAVLGYRLPKNIEDLRYTLALKLNLSIYKNIFAILQEAELTLKTNSKVDKSAILYSTLIKIQTLL